MILVLLAVVAVVAARRLRPAAPVARVAPVAPVAPSRPRWVTEKTPGYDIKLKLSSGIYHQRGGLAYERTKPDRWYASADDAMADGFRAAKR